MNERTMKLRLGAAVVLSVVIIIIFLTFLGSKEKFVMSSYQIQIQLLDAPNVVVNTPIFQSGILIGRVAHVELTEDSGVLVTARIYNNHKLYRDQECHLTSSLLGDASLRMISMTKEDANGKELDHSPIQPGDVIQGRTSINPTVMMAQIEEKLTEAIDDVTAASSQLTAVAITTNEMLSENRQNVKDIMGNARNITEHSESITAHVAKILDDEFCANLQISVANLKEAALKMPGTLDKVNVTLDDMQATVKLTNTTIENVAKKLENSLGGVDQALETTNSILANIDKITKPFTNDALRNSWIANISNVLRNMDTFTEMLNRRDSTIGMLMNDREMYDRLRSTLEQVSELPRKLDPILFNAQVMTEKLAQHPELLGLRGYLKKDDGTSHSIPWPKGITQYSPYSTSSPSSAYYNYYSYPSRVSTYNPTQVTPSVSTAPKVPATHNANPVQSGYLPSKKSVLHPAVSSPKTTTMPSSIGCRVASQPIPQSGEVTPEMLGMTPEEFKNASHEVISDTLMSVTVAGSPNLSEPENDMLILPPATMPSHSISTLKPAEK